MDFDEMINEYGTYNPELKNFKSYLLSDSTSINTKLLGGIRTEHIMESIDYNVKYNGYTSKSIASKYAIAIAQFYRYATQQNWFSNDDFLNHINMYRLDEDSYYYRIGNYIKKNPKLTGKAPKPSCTQSEVNTLITTIDEYFEKHKDSIENMSFPKTCGMLAIKIMLLTGAKYSIIPNLKYYDLNTELNTIKIKKYTLRLPVKLSSQFHIYNKLRNITLANPSEYLFCTQSGDPWKGTSPNSNIVDFLSVVILRQDTTGITKYGISNLLKAGIGITEIEKLTDAKTDIIRGCMTNEVISEDDLINKYLNMCIANIDCYYKL